MKRILPTVYRLLFLSALSAQSTRKIRELENKRKELLSRLLSR